ncbi:DUF421 domain-containing protein [Aequorivita sediminis]|uniref:DUF421 domain-containing protein n=1 Tax=Aequorivita sediminis TaxID=3073653 RepID=UPI0028B139BB|nr:YetF domain-containing protein [Aequorivita sp. F6058]
MEKLFSISNSEVIKIVISAIAVYVAVIIYTRVFGKRSFSKMSSFDFAMTVAIGSLIASTILTSSISISEGVLGLLVVYLLQLTAAYFRRFEFFAKTIDNTPLLLMDGSNILHKNLAKARVTEGDLRAKLREANVLELSQVRAVIFETTGDIAVLHTDKESQEVESWLLKDVMK